MGTTHLLREAFLLRARNEMVDQDAEPPLARWRELGDTPDEVVDAVHRFDDDAELAQVVSPDVLEQFGIVPTLDPDPAGPGHPGP